MKHEIDIPGLPDGWRAVAYRLGKAGEYFFCGTYEEVMMLDEDTEFILVLIVEKIKPRRVVLEELGHWHIDSTEGYVLVPAESLIDMIDIEESQPDWMCYKVVEEE